MSVCSAEASQKKTKVVVRSGKNLQRRSIVWMHSQCWAALTLEVEEDENLEEVRVSRWASHMCDKCSAKRVKFCELAAIVTEEGGATHTTNLCRNRCDKRRSEQGQANVDGVGWKELIKQKYQTQAVGCFLGRSLPSKNVGAIYSWARKVLEDAAGVTQLGTDGNWQNESLHKEPELLRNIGDLSFDGSLLRKACNAVKSGDWEEFLENDRLSALKVKCYNGVDEDRKSIAQQIMQKTNDPLRRIIAPVGGQGGDTSSNVCFACH